MELSTDELKTLGFRRAGTVYPDAATVCRVQVDGDLKGYAVYAMRVGCEIKKFGTTGRKNSGFKSRMHSTFSALRQTIVKGPPHQGGPFKTHAPATILAGQEIELWGRPSTEATFEIEESELNNKYRPQWTKEGRTGSVR